MVCYLKRRNPLIYPAFGLVLAHLGREGLKVLLRAEGTFKLSSKCMWVTDPPRANSTRQYQPICNPTLDIASTFKPIVQFEIF